jgi:hypothetical protein
MYYRVAIQRDPPSFWQWKSTALSELSALFQWLRLYRALPHTSLLSGHYGTFSSKNYRQAKSHLFHHLSLRKKGRK